MELIIGVIFTIVIAFIMFSAYSQSEKIRQKVRKECFANRIKMPIDDIFNNHYAVLNVNKSSFIKKWKEIAKLLEVDPGIMQPSDRYDKEYAYIEGTLDEDDTEFLLQMYWDRCREIKVSTHNEFPFKTIDELIRFLLLDKERSIELFNKLI